MKPNLSEEEMMVVLEILEVECDDGEATHKKMVKTTKIKNFEKIVKRLMRKNWVWSWCYDDKKGGHKPGGYWIPDVNYGIVADFLKQKGINLREFQNFETRVGKLEAKADSKLRPHLYE